MLHKILLLLSGNAAASLLLFARNLLVARLISVEDYGIAATFALAMAVVEMASNLGLQQMIIQSRRGDDPKFQATLQGFQVLRGCVSALVLFLAADLMAEFLRIPEVTWAYQVLALVPILNALQHFDMYRLSRKMRFGPMLLVGTVPAAVSLLAIWPLGVWISDFRVMLYALVLQAMIGMVTSHWVAERSYQLSLDRDIMLEAFSFGWPLLINGFLLFAVFQGDKIIVGRELGMVPLALLAMGVTLTLTPALVMGKSIQNFFLPQLSTLAAERERNPDSFEAACQAVLQATFLTGIVLVAVILALGPWVILGVLGEKYSDLLPLLTLFAVQQGLRVLKAGPNLVALSCGVTINAMISNAVRVACLPIAWWVVVQGGGLVSLLLVGLVAELLGFWVAFQQMASRQTISIRRSLPALGLPMLFFLIAGLLGWEAVSVAYTWLFWALPVLLGASLLTMSDLRKHVSGKT